MKPYRHTPLAHPLSPPFTPPQSSQRSLSYVPKPSVQPAMFRPATIHQLSLVLGEPIRGIELLHTTNLHQLIRVRLSDGRAVLMKSFIHHSTPVSAFTAMVESCLQDAEDLTLTMPYDHIRTAVDTHQRAFDHVQKDRLVLLAPSSGLRKLGASESAIGPVQECLLWGDDLMAEVLETWPAPAYALSPPSENGYASSPSAKSRPVKLLLCTCLKSIHTIISSYHDRESHHLAELTARQQLTASLAKLVRKNG